MNTEILHKEIDLIQACISRMAHNSFLLKGWAVSLVAVILAIDKQSSQPDILGAITLIPLLCFWILDAFFLQAEKRFREMYKWVLHARPSGDYSFLYDLNPHRFKKETDSLVKVLFSVTLAFFYGPPIAIVLFIIIAKACSLTGGN